MISGLRYRNDDVAGRQKTSYDICDRSVRARRHREIDLTEYPASVRVSREEKRRAYRLFMKITEDKVRFSTDIIIPGIFFMNAGES